MTIIWFTPFSFLYERIKSLVVAILYSSEMLILHVVLKM